MFVHIHFNFTSTFRLPFEIKPNQKPIELNETDQACAEIEKTLNNLEFVITGKTATGKTVLENKIQKLGGVIQKEVTESTAALISTEKDLGKDFANIQKAKKFNVDVVAETFLKDVIDFKNTPKTLIKKNAISSWGGDVQERTRKALTKLHIESEEEESSESDNEKESQKSIKMVVKGGGVVDPDFYAKNMYHVYRKGDEKFTITLGITDVNSNKNRFSKLQILEKDNYCNYWYDDYVLLQKNGKIGGNFILNNTGFSNIENCIKKFKDFFKKKTGNNWEDKNNFIKKAKLMYPIDEDYYGEENILFNNEIESKLEEPIKEFVDYITDFNSMNQALKDYEIDTKKLPLGKLSEKQIHKAFGVLTDLLDKIKRNALPFEIESDTNKFFTLIPHKFGKKGPAVLDTEDKIKEKSRMLESLKQLETAYKLYHSNYDPLRNSTDVMYLNLKTNISILDKQSPEFAMIETYVKNTHGITHNTYKLVIKEVFQVDREGESKRYSQFKNFHNRMLLWHGSRRTNFANILINGLRIAPPEVPHTGYMFGKGIYFSDSVSKAANYCKVYNGSDGLVLLCEVALGNMLELTEAKYIQKTHFHSVWGRGRIIPDESISLTMKDGVKVPYGPHKVTDLKSSLHYNEFIVYNPSQVKIKYIVRLNFTSPR